MTIGGKAVLTECVVTVFVVMVSRASPRIIQVGFWYRFNAKTLFVDMATYRYDGNANNYANANKTLTIYVGINTA